MSVQQVIQLVMDFAILWIPILAVVMLGLASVIINAWDRRRLREQQDILGQLFNDAYESNRASAINGAFRAVEQMRAVERTDGNRPGK